jgi:hypothetical protein
VSPKLSLHQVENLHVEVEGEPRAQMSTLLISDLFFVSNQMDSSQLHILFLITLELTFHRLLIKERAKQELARSGLEARNRTIPCPE